MRKRISGVASQYDILTDVKYDIFELRSKVFSYFITLLGLCVGKGGQRTFFMRRY